MYYIYNKLNSKLIYKTSKVEELKWFSPNLVDVVLY